MPASGELSCRSRLCHWLAFACLGCAIWTGRAGAQITPAASVLYDEGTRAWAEGLPSVATFKLRAFLRLDLSTTQRREATFVLVRALLAAADPAGAQTALDAAFPAQSDSIDATPDPELAFWRGQVQAARTRWTEALVSYTRAAQSPRLPAPATDLRPQARFGQGECLLGLNRPAEAAEILTPLCADPLLGESARLRCAEIALNQGKLDEAIRMLRTDGAFDPADASHRLQNKERAYLLGRLRLAQRQPVQAESAFTAALARPEGLSERLLVDLSWGVAQARLDQGKLDTGEDALEILVERYPRSLFLPRTVAWLETLYLRDPRPDLSDIRRWTADGTQTDRQTLALLTLGRVEAHLGSPDHAEETFLRLIEEFPDHPLHARALVDLAALRLRLGRPAEARAALDQARPQVVSLARDDRPAAASITGPPSTRPTSPSSWRTELDVLDARISLAEHDRVKAAAGFAAVAERLKEGPQAEAAAFNSVLCWLRAVDVARFTAAEADFRRRFPGSPLNAEFPLEEGLARASLAQPTDRLGRQRAVASLRTFLRDHPDHPRAAEARVALAELAFARPRPNLAIAWQELDAPGLRPVANDEPAALPGDRARAEYLAVWLADAPGPDVDEEKAIALAKKFLVDHADSPLAAEVRMKLGSIYFKRADYPDAQTQLELLAENAPNSPLAEPALYLAGMSAASSMSPAGMERAVAHFKAVALRNGPLRLAAWLRQADVQNQLDRNGESLLLYNSVLNATSDAASLSDADLDARCAALGSLGRTLMAMAANDPKLQGRHYAEAVRTFDQLKNTPGASLLWRRQALVQKGNALEKTGEIDAALASYDDALNAPEPAPASPAPPNAPDVPEWTWFYRAGREAARLLESRAQWAAAIAVYKKLAAADGPMKSEFENLLGQRRLEHFIWED